MINKLVNEIKKKNAPIVVGLDPMENYIPECVKSKAYAEFGETLAGAGEAVWQYNKALIDAVADIVPAVKPQIAMYEQFGIEGLIGRFQRLGSAPAHFSDGRLRIGNAQPSFYAVLIQKTAECAIAGFYGAIACGKNFLVRQDAKRTESQGAHSGGFDKFSAGYFWEHNITTFLLAWSNPSKAIIPGQKISSVPIQNL